MTLVARALITGGIIAFMVISAPYANAGTSPEEVKKFEDFKERAKNGDAKALFGLGFCYFYGVGVATDKVTSVSWWSKAAAQGHPAAQCNLGYCYENGEGVPVDSVKAVEWFRKSAEQGYF